MIVWVSSRKCEKSPYLNVEKFSNYMLQAKIIITPDLCFSDKRKSGLEFDSKPQDERVSDKTKIFLLLFPIFRPAFPQCFHWNALFQSPMQNGMNDFRGKQCQSDCSSYIGGVLPYRPCQFYGMILPFCQ